MKNIFLALFLVLASFSANAASPSNPGIIPSLTIGGRVLTDVSSRLIELTCYASGTNCTFRKLTASSGYTPSGSKTFVVYAASTIVQTASAGSAVKICYADNDVGQDSGSAFTNQVYMGGTTSLGTIAGGGTTGYQDTVVHRFVIPNGKYPCARVDASVQGIIRIFGYEE